MFEYELTIFVLIGIGIIYSLAQNIMLGMAGQPMFGVIALVAFGAYTAALLTVNVSLPFWITIPAAGAIAAFIGLLFGWLTIRIRGDYLCIASIGLVYITASLFTDSPWFGRMFGIINISRPSVFGFVLNETWQFAILTWIIVGTLIFFELKLGRSSLGLALRSIRDDEDAAESLGIDSVRAKVTSFVIGSAFAGIGGSLLAFFLKSIHPEYFDFGATEAIFLMPIFGGLGTTIGAVLGATILVALPEVLRFIAEYRSLLFGILLVLLPLYQPMGLFGTGSFLRRKIGAVYKYIMGR